MARAVVAKKHAGRGLKLVAVIAATLATSTGVPETRVDDNMEAPVSAAAPVSNISKLIDGLKEVPERDWTDSQKLLASRLGRQALELISQKNEEGRNFFRNACIVKDPYEVESKDPNVVVLPVRSDDKGSYMQAFHVKPEVRERLESWLFGISNEHIRAAFPEIAEKLILEKAASPNNFRRFALVQLANANPQFKETFFRWGDENHPFWNEDGTIKKEILPEGFRTVHFKGSGEGPIAEEDLHLVDKVQDAYWFKKSERVTPLDRRYLATDLDMARNGVGYLVEYFLRRFKGVRPTDLDKDYAFRLEEDQPFLDAVKWTVEPQTMAQENQRFLVKNPCIAKIWGNVPELDRPAPIFSRAELMELGFRAKLVKTFVEGGDRSEGSVDKNVVGKATD